MKTADVDILIVPGWQDSGPDHWQSRWERSLKTARRVIQDDWDNPCVEAWGNKIAKAFPAARRKSAQHRISLPPDGTLAFGMRFLRHVRFITRTSA